MKNKTAISVKNALENIIYIEGSPKAIQTDNGTEFVNDILQSFLSEKK